MSLQLWETLSSFQLRQDCIDWLAIAAITRRVRHVGDLVKRLSVPDDEPEGRLHDGSPVEKLMQPDTYGRSDATLNR